MCACRDAALASALFANRAQAHLLLGNHRSALDDALAALRADSGNVKVCAWTPCTAAC